MSEIKAIADQVGLETFAHMVRLGLWIVQSCEEHKLELAYFDDELITFRHESPLSKKIVHDKPL